MNLADKILNLRKQAGLSQEELAEHLNVSRQSISKWEGSQSAPETDKIIQMSQLFSVSTDYLLKDDLLDKQVVEQAGSSGRRVTYDEAVSFIQIRQRYAKWVALGVALCILSPTLLIILSIGQESGQLKLSEGAATTLGIVFCLLLNAIGGGIIIFSLMQFSDYDYMEKETLALDPGIVQLVQEKKKTNRGHYISMNVAAVMLFILCPLMIIVPNSILPSDFISGFGISGLLLLVALAVACLILANVPWDTYQILLQEGEYQPEKKATRSKLCSISPLYWTLTTLLYLGLSFWSGQWGNTWMVWPLAGIIYGVVALIIDLLDKRQN